MNVTFILKDQTERIVSFTDGQTLLEVAEENRIPIHGACEGACICGGCHVLIENLADKLPKISDQENDALDNAHGVVFNKSRLACQVVLTPELDGLRVCLPHGR
ncbi:ferredoxin [Alphaproteobacteria bacterium]|nr:ferredoxin [Alphaproteobacteria bacterium]